MKEYIYKIERRNYMRTYFIRTYRREESEKVLDVLSKHVVTDIKRERASYAYESINFECEKTEWKSIKKELNLEITSIFSKIRVD